MTKRQQVRGMSLYQVEADVRQEVVAFLMEKFKGKTAAKVEDNFPLQMRLSDHRSILIHGRAPKKVGADPFDINIFVEFLAGEA